MEHAKPEIQTVTLAAQAIRTVFQKGFELIFDNAFRFLTVTAYEGDEQSPPPSCRPSTEGMRHTKERQMKYEKPRFLALHALSEIRAAQKCLCAVLEGAPPYLYVSSPSAYESDE